MNAPTKRSLWVACILCVSFAAAGCDALDGIAGNLSGEGDGNEGGGGGEDGIVIPFRNTVNMRQESSGGWRDLGLIGEDEEGDSVVDGLGDLVSLYAAHNFYNLYLTGELGSDFPNAFDLVIASDSSDWDIEIGYEYDSEFDFGFMTGISSPSSSVADECFVSPDGFGIGSLIEFEIDFDAGLWTVKIPGFENPQVDCGPTDFRLDDLYVLIRAAECGEDSCDRLGIAEPIRPEDEVSTTLEIPFTGQNVTTAIDIYNIPGEDFLILEDLLEPQMSNPTLDIDTLQFSIDEDHLYVYFYAHSGLDTNEGYEIEFYDGTTPQSSLVMQSSGGSDWNYFTDDCTGSSVDDSFYVDEIEGDILLVINRQDCLRLGDDTDIDAVQMRTTFDGATMDLFDIVGIELGN